MIGREQVHEGMVVRSSDGKDLGRVLLCEEGRFIVEKHLFSTIDYVARYDDVADVSGGELVLARSRDELAQARVESAAGPPQTYGDEGGGGWSGW